MEGQYQWHPFIICRPGLISSLLNTAYVVCSKLYYSREKCTTVKGRRCCSISEPDSRQESCAAAGSDFSSTHYVCHPPPLHKRCETRVPRNGEHTPCIVSLCVCVCVCVFSVRKKKARKKWINIDSHAGDDVQKNATAEPL